MIWRERAYLPTVLVLSFIIQLKHPFLSLLSLLLSSSFSSSSSSSSSTRNAVINWSLSSKNPFIIKPFNSLNNEILYSPFSLSSWHPQFNCNDNISFRKYDHKQNRNSKLEKYPEYFTRECKLNILPISLLESVAADEPEERYIKISVQKISVGVNNKEVFVIDIDINAEVDGIARTFATNNFNESECEQCNMIQYNTIQYNTIQYNTIQYNTIQYNTIQYYTI